MSSLFYTPTEKRYADYPRRWLNEYHIDSRHKTPQAKGSCGTLASARKQAARAVDQGFCTTVRIFDRRTGQYVFTYKAAVSGILRHEGYVR
jgi:exonuclease III